ncbi:MAG: sodium:proton antiporter [Micavibrio aeruginosavorus]|uniref:Sodium:proton antiporter n=1 Tax=Micavibrio aeruginosavorus TaxID=349221 RepID=A0A2W5MPT8_9BACT|nr:MAG: sodium:proton antiporter [Micavibrio aeruginosavorus]
MHDQLPLVTTIAVGLSVAFVLGLIAARLRLPPIVGYLLAGILIGPHSPGFVADVSLSTELSEIGIVLLMFGVGLHFSLKDLLEVKGIAVPGAIGQMITATAMGAFLSMYFWDWSLPSGILFGLALSVASTVVLLRTLEQYSMTQSTNGQIAVGWLIVEDLAMVFALVMIPALAGDPTGGATAVQDAANGGATSVMHAEAGHSPLLLLAKAIVKVGMFLVAMLVGGKRLFPWLLKLAVKTRSRELFTLAVFAVAVGVAFGASKLFDVSFALGAFFAGMMIRESDMNHEVADRALPFQDAFAVLFFVSVGMLFDPEILMAEPLGVFLVFLIITIGKSIAAFFIVLLFGYPLKTALFVSAGLAQIGEFSFILVGLGVAYGIMPEEGRDLILAGALFSIAFNPLFFWALRALHNFAVHHPKWSRVFDLRESNLSELVDGEADGLKNDLVIVVGYGQIGREICDNILDAKIDLVIIDANRERVEMLRELGYHAITGDATHEETLRASAIDKALAIVISVPDSFEGRRIVDAARKLKPNIHVVVRAHNDEEVFYFRKKNVNFVTTPAREIGRSIIHYIEMTRSGLVPLNKTDY